MADKKISKVIFGGETFIDLTSDTVTPEKMLKNATAHDKSGETIIGSCTFDADTQDATASESEILLDKTAYVNGQKVTGTMPNNEAVQGKITDKDTPYNIPTGFHDGSGTVEIDDTEKEKLIPGNIKAGIKILGVTGEYAGEADKVQTKTVTPTKDGLTVTPDPEYDYLSQVTVNAIPYSEADNPQGGKTVTIG